MSAGVQISSIKAIQLKGYRLLRDLEAHLGSLEVIVGANGSGKSALFEFFHILRDGMYEGIPPGVIPNAVGQQVFHLSGPDEFSWDIAFDRETDGDLHYQGAVIGPLGRIRVANETVNDPLNLPLLGMQGDIAHFSEPTTGQSRSYAHMPSNQLLLRTANDPILPTLSNLHEHIRNWHFYSASSVDMQAIRRPILIEQEPVLREDAGNLGSVLNYLFTEYPQAFEELKQFLRSTVPGFKNLAVKARGGPGQVMTLWHEDGVTGELSLADVSDGIVRLLCWGAVCVHPKPPTLVCLDEPEQGVHPRTLPFLAGMVKKLAHRTQVLVATHSSYFLTQFALPQIAVMRKENGEARYLKPQDSKVLAAMLEDFGAEEIEVLHRSDELEDLA